MVNQTHRTRAAGLLSALAVAFCALSACSRPTFPDISIDSRAHVDEGFARRTTFQWIGALVFVGDTGRTVSRADFDLKQEIQHLASLQMRRKGFRQVAENGRLLGIYGLNIDEPTLRLIAQNHDIEITFEVPTRGLAVLFADSETGELVWVGSAQSTKGGPATLNLTRERLTHAIRVMLKGFPE